MSPFDSQGLQFFKKGEDVGLSKELFRSPKSNLCLKRYCAIL